jgi:hypothetical protein
MTLEQQQKKGIRLRDNNGELKMKALTRLNTLIQNPYLYLIFNC